MLTNQYTGTGNGTCFLAHPVHLVVVGKPKAGCKPNAGDSNKGATRCSNLTNIKRGGNHSSAVNLLTTVESGMVNGERDVQRVAGRSANGRALAPCHVTLCRPLAGLPSHDTLYAGQSQGSHCMSRASRTPNSRARSGRHVTLCRPMACLLLYDNIADSSLTLISVLSPHVGKFIIQNIDFMYTRTEIRHVGGPFM